MPRREPQLTFRYELSEHDRGVYVPVYQNPTAARLAGRRGHDRDLAISTRWTDATVFLTDEAGELIGTGFLVQYGEIARDEVGDVVRPLTLYLVTAYHVVKDVPQVFARLRLADDSVLDVAVDRWWPDPKEPDTSDVAVAPFRMPDAPCLTNPAEFAHAMTGGADHPWFSLGHDVYYAGLLTHVPSMGDRMIPMVRSGKLGAWNQGDVPFRPEGQDEELLVRAHLIDCYGYYGFSGSPCFLQLGMDVPDSRGYMSSPRTGLLGVLLGFFGYIVEAALGPEYDLPVNAGVAIVAPAWNIKRILLREELVEDREKRRDQEATVRRTKKGVKSPPATSAGARPGPEPQRLKLDGTLEENVKKALHAGKPDASEEEESERS